MKLRKRQHRRSSSRRLRRGNFSTGHGVPLVLVAILSAVVVSFGFNQAYSEMKEKDRGMDV